MVSAIPTDLNAYRTESSGDFPLFFAFAYFNRKCTVSSTTIPNVIAATMDTAKVTEPTVYPHNPNAIAAGTRFGTSDINPSFTFRNTSKITPEINIKAKIVP
ncbi:MAG: Uncharacterised protein [SAR116 cluster bacterium]|nr:MAG: Uncharacterised protein [SAR116 cluster bacterium]